MRQRQRQARRADAAGVADSPINFGGKLSAATHTLATVVECSERAYGCTVEERRGVDEVMRPAEWQMRRFRAKTATRDRRLGRSKVRQSRK